MGYHRVVPAAVINKQCHKIFETIKSFNFFRAWPTRTCDHVVSHQKSGDSRPDNREQAEIPELIFLSEAEILMQIFNDALALT